MARRFEAIVCTDVSGNDAAEVGGRLREWLFREGILLPDLDADQEHPAGPNAARATSCGEECGTARIVVGRGIYWSEWGHNMYCPACEYTVEPEDDEALDAMRRWESGAPAGEVSCPDCGLTKPLTEWDSDWGYGNLGVEFWQWPPLSYGFVHRVQRLTGSRLTVARGGRG